MTTSEKIERSRNELDRLTDEFVKLISRRDKLVTQICKEKKRLGLPILDLEREKEVIERAEKAALREGIDLGLVKELLELIIEHSKRVQR